MQRWMRMTWVLLILIGFSYPAGALAEKKFKDLSLYLKMGLRYDDNVRLEAFDTDLFADDSDRAGVIFFSGRYSFFKGKQFELSAGYAHYQIMYQDISDYDVVGSIGQLITRYKWHDFTFGLTYQPAYYQVDYRRFIRQHQIKPDVMWKARKNLIMRFKGSYSDNTDFQETLRDGSTLSLEGDAYYLLPKKKHQIFGGIGYARNAATHNDYDWRRLRLKLGGSFGLPHKVRLVVTGKREDKYYENVDSNFAVQRRDAKYFLSLSASRPFLYKWLSVVLDYQYTYNDSNIAGYKYDKQEVTLSMIIRY